MKRKENGLEMRRTYEAPRAEVIEIETQGVLCASGGGSTPTPSPTGAGGNGFQFGTSNGQW